MAKRTCSIETCPDPVHARDWCATHYGRWLADRDMNAPRQRYAKRPTGIDPIAWFWMGFQRADNGCLEWQRAEITGGYGQCSGHLGSRRTHRVAWILTNGPIPDGMRVLHRCDNPPCGDPEHLFLGTDADNVRDKMAKGRHAHAHGPAPLARPLTGPQVLGILLRLEGGEMQKSIAARYGTGESTISRIKRGKTWSDYRL